MVSPKRDHFAIGFDSTDDNKFLVFGPSPKTNGRFVLLAKEWNRQEGIVTYGGETFRTPAQSAFSYLLVELDNKARTKVSKNVEKGRKIN